MKYIKSYEKIASNPQIGDYILRKPTPIHDEVDDFLSTNIGQIIDYKIFKENQYMVKYHINFSEHNFNKGKFQFLMDPDGDRLTRLDQIEFFSSDKEEVETYIATKKYNI